MVIESKKTVIICAFRKFLKLERYWNKWISLNSLASEFLLCHPEIVVIVVISSLVGNDLSREFGTTLDDFTSSNQSGFFMFTTTYTDHDKNKKKGMCFSSPSQVLSLEGPGQVTSLKLLLMFTLVVV